jgi:hypothetical protein
LSSQQRRRGIRSFNGKRWASSSEKLNNKVSRALCWTTEDTRCNGFFSWGDNYLWDRQKKK